jgi:hypothetical protein
MGYRRMWFRRRLYRVYVVPEAGYTHLLIERADGRPIRSTWDVLQAIKDDAVGADRYAVEVFPDKNSLVYRANARHLWVFPEGQRLALGANWDRADNYHQPYRTEDS